MTAVTQEGSFELIKLHTVERLLITVGLVLCWVYAYSRLNSVLASKALLISFEAKAAQPLPPQESGTATAKPRPIGFAGWSAARIAAYRKALGAVVDAPLAMLSIPKIGLEVPVLNGTDTRTLDYAVGRIPGTALPGQRGNIGIAGHRDGFFRGLKAIAVGDTLILSTLDARSTYVVDSVRIVNPTDVSVLDRRAAPSLTLVTCYPFFFIGDAPRRFIVQATLNETGTPPHGGPSPARTVN